MRSNETITVDIPVDLALALSEMKETYAPLLKAVGQICFDELYRQKILKEG